MNLALDALSIFPGNLKRDPKESRLGHSARIFLIIWYEILKNLALDALSTFLIN